MYFENTRMCIHILLNPPQRKNTKYRSHSFICKFIINKWQMKIRYNLSGLVNIGFCYLRNNFFFILLFSLSLSSPLSFGILFWENSVSTGIFSMLPARKRVIRKGHTDLIYFLCQKIIFFFYSQFFFFK